MTPDSHHVTHRLSEAEFNPLRFFDGKLEASGFFMDRGGKVRRRFTVDIHCQATDEQTSLHEFFTYDDGETEDRVWVLQRQSDTHFAGYCDDVDGQAECVINGSQMTLRYDFFLSISGRRIKFHFDDMMVYFPDGRVVNRAKVSKFGITIGELVISFARAA